MATPLTGIAKRVHDDILRLDPEGAKLYAQMVIVGALQHDIETHRDLLQHRVDQIITKRAAALKESVVRTYVSKRASGESIEHLHAVAEVISKAGFTDLTDAQRRELTRMQDRDVSGRFKTMHRKINYHTTKPMSGRTAIRQGIRLPESAKDLPDKDRARYQQAWRQVADMVGQFREAPEGSATLHLTYKQGTEFSHVMSTVDPEKFDPSKKTGLPKGGVPPIDPHRFRDGGKLVDAQVIVDGGLTTQGAAFNLIGALTDSPTLGGRTANMLREDENVALGQGHYPATQRLNQFNTDWQERLDTDVTDPANRIYRRIGHGSQLLGSILGPNAPMAAQLAVTTGGFVSEFGPEAQKVIGPHADRAAYRYRGVERKPSPGIQGNLNAATQRLGVEDGRKALLYGQQREVATRGGTRLDFAESPVVEYFRGRLPVQELTHLQRKSGVIPPSEGVIVNRKGQVVTQAVGYGDDWYLPFNLKTLSKLKGGHYVRTRTWGGPTTEDVYAGLMAGAHSLTVVSHNGVYTVEFDDSFRGKRRYSDKAARMVKRYGHLLDAAKSEQVTADIPPERVEELRQEISLETGLDPKRREDRTEFKAKLNAAREDERQHPTMGESGKRALAEEFLTAQANNLATTDSYASDWKALADQYVVSQVERDRKAYMARFADGQGFEPSMFATAAREAVSDPVRAAETMYGEEWEKALADGEAKYRSEHSPLKLDGEGYYQSLRALREQFPYYIANVDYRPNTRTGTDYGYVKPRFNRPQGAEAGYFDETITGAKKISADQIRHQNARVDVKAVYADRAKERAAEGKPAEASRTGIFGQKPSADQEIEAMIELRDEIRARPDIMFEGRQQALAPVRAQFDANLRWLFGMDEQTFLREARNDREGTKKGLLADLQQYESLRLGPVDHAKIDRIKDPAGADKGHAFDLLDAMHGGKDRNYDFPGLEPGHRQPEHYQNIAAAKLRELKLDPETSDEALNGFIDEWHKMYKKAEANGGPGQREIPRLKKKIEQAFMVKQARRRAKEAQSKLDAAKELQDARMREAMAPQLWAVQNQNLMDQLLRQQRELGGNGPIDLGQQ